MIYNKIISLFKYNIKPLFFLSYFFIVNTFANTPDAMGDESWKSRIFSDIENCSCINILDLNNTIEPCMLIKYNCFTENNKKLSLLFKDKTISIYKVIDNNDLSLIDTNKTYILFFFKSSDIYTDNLSIKLGKSVYFTKYSLFYEVSTFDTNINKETAGMLSFVNIDSLELLESSRFPLNGNLKKIIYNNYLLDKIIKIGDYVVRQTKLQSMIEHDHILNAKQISETADKSILPIPSDSYIQTMIYNYNHTIKQVLSYMHDLASAVAYLHANNIAHGDISIANLFMLKTRLVLSGFEYFSKFSKTENEVLGVKTASFSANMHYPPEFRSLLGNSTYNQASYSADVWSLGLVLATMLYNYYQHDLLSSNSKLKKLNIYNEIDDYNYQQYISSFYTQPYTYRRCLISPESKLKTWMTYGIYYICNSIVYRKCNATIPNNNFNHILESIIEIINECHNQNPKLRLTAAEVKNKLSILIDES